MINSMTGFGRATCLIEGREMTVELKSVNHRYLDIAYRMPRHIGFLEEYFRAILQEQLSRGHVDVYVNYRNTRKDARIVEIDAALLAEYIASARGANETLMLPDDLSLTAALRLPDVTNIIEADEDREAVCELAKKTMLLALLELKSMRAKEGKRLNENLYARADVLHDLHMQIMERAPQVVKQYKTKLTERLESALNNAEIDRARLATEIALFADKANIEEELVRLESHIQQYRALLESNAPVGRKLDFLVQEMNREFNTMGSKANDAALVDLVLLGKAEIEMIREQIQNIE